ncbi:hypothetical protein H257_16597 [Aphanomyces astaci]|uniref:DUF4436 domain-containing protein n=2 Tax=Aphanomyces astaci TaxID=112090 RepID=W4FJK5_APHAT|nr:hypothetical protein H257_16597 [Aphanomyces astaci]ETV67021.1 hypothetical protein H257_16597 [Aphanomyces astaci]|eukprot:XP_009843390.1 hypothetical protein H257_16597 [Aphanomyces astaci]
MAIQDAHVHFVEVTTPRPKGTDQRLLESGPNSPSSRRRRYHFHKQWLLQGIVLVAFATLFLCVVIPFVHNNEHIQALRINQNGTTTVSNPSNTGKVNMLVSISGMSTETYEVTVSAVLNQVPASVLNNDSTRIVTPFRLQVGSNVLAINENTTYVNAPVTSKVPLLTGSLAWYPFDKYLMKLEVQTVTGTSQYNAGGFKPIQDLDFVVLTPSDYTWTYTVRDTKPDDFGAFVPGVGTVSDLSKGYTSLTIEVTRDFNIYMALVFVGIWAVTIAIGWIGSMSVIWKRRPADNPVIFISALFAVPTFRNTAPGKPPYGCLFDILCTYFSIGVIITFLLLVAFAYMKKAKKTARHKKDDDDTIPVATLDAGGNVAGDAAAAGDAGDAGGGGDAGDAGGGAGDA